MKYVIFLIASIILFSCSKKENKIDKDFNKIDNLIYEKKYSDAEKYINAIIFMKSDILNKKNIKTLNYKLGKLYYLYLNRDYDAYYEFQKLIEKEKLEKFNDIEILEYLADISKKIKPEEEIKWLKFLIYSNKEINKNYLYRYVNIIKKKIDKNELNNIIKKYSNDIVLKLIKIDLIKDNKIALKELNKLLNNTKNKKEYDMLLFKKISILEKSKNIDYKLLVKKLSFFKTDLYLNVIEQKRNYYTQHINLESKK